MDWLTQIQMQLRSNKELLMVALAIAFLVYHWSYAKALWPSLQSAFAWLTTRSPGVTAPAVGVPALTDAQLDFAAIERLQISANKRNCPECKAAVQAYLSHMFDDKRPATVTFTTASGA